MGEDTLIAWTDHTFNPWIGCTKVSDGCKNCYAEVLATGKMGLDVWGPKATRQATGLSTWNNPVQWNARAKREGSPRKVFCASLCDVFEDHPTANALRPRVWNLISVTPWLQWQLLTKRPERIVECLPEDWGAEGWPHVWLGTTVEDMRVAHRADILRQIPAVVRFLSFEPALGPLDTLDLTNIDWVIYGGESGPGFRPEDKNWARVMRDRCRQGGVAFFHKQSAAWRTELGIELDGQIIREFPIPRLVQMSPAVDVEADLFGG